MTETEYALALALEQGSPEWLAFKCGRVGASRIADITAKLKNGTSGASRAAYQGELIAERLTGIPANGYTNAAMQWGTECEPLARARYQFETLSVVARVGVVIHPKLDMALASPDGLVGADGLVEIKCPHVTNNHIEALLGASVPGKYQQQMQWQMACTGRAWCDYVSFDPRMPEHMQIHVQRLERDDAVIATLEAEVEEFLEEIEERLATLRSRYAA
jgi:putative phage-type endonuclease